MHLKLGVQTRAPRDESLVEAPLLMPCFPPVFVSVQFSKEKYLLESPPEKLRKELEEELKLSAADIRSHGWYHGHIPREVLNTVESVCIHSISELELLAD